MTTSNSWRHRQAHRALERQLDYQQHKALAVAGREADIVAAMFIRTPQLLETDDWSLRVKLWLPRR